MHSQYVTRQAGEQSKRRETKHADAAMWNILQSAGMSRLSELLSTIRDIAPHPGALVFVEMKSLPFRWDDWQPVLFSSIDLCTHLQIGRMYMTPTHASAVDFLQFISESYPFPLNEVRTIADPVFSRLGSLQSEHQFTAQARKRGIFHSIVLDPAEHPVLRDLSKYNFCAALNDDLHETTKETAVNGLANFLFFHNNHRSLVTLGGLTPLQKLNTFSGYEDIHWFDHYRPNEVRRAGGDGQ